MNEQAELRAERLRLEHAYAETPFSDPERRGQIAALLEEVSKDQAAAQEDRLRTLAERRERRSE